MKKLCKQRMFRLLTVFLLIAMVVGVTVVSAAEPAAQANSDLVLEDMAILVPAQPTDVEKSAAAELKLYLQRITGKAPAILLEGSTSEPAIYVGDTEYAKAQGVTLYNGAYTDQNGLGEGWAIKAVDGNLILTGGEKRGTMYAVYHLLEDQLGVRWWNLWEEYVPTMEDATLPRDFSVSGEPAFGYRDPYIMSDLGSNLFFVRNRANGYGTGTPATYGSTEAWGRPNHVYTSEFYFPAYFQSPTNKWDALWYDTVNPDMISWYLYDDPNSDNPDGSTGGEFFAWSASRQERVSSGQLCLSNETLRDMMKENIVKAIELSYYEADMAGKPRPKYFDFSLNATGADCECPDCLGSVEKYGRSGHLLRFVNMIAHYVEQAGYTDAIIETLLSTNYLNPPKTDEYGNYMVIPARNVMLRLNDSTTDILQDLWHPNNMDAYERLRQWSDICDLDGDGVIESSTEPELMFWDYGAVYTPNGIFPNQYRFQSLLQAYQNAGAWGSFMEIQRPNNTEFWDMKVWMLTKLMEDPYQDEKELMMDFLNGYYGDAAGEHLYDYLTYMQSKAELYDELVLFSFDGLLGAEFLDAEDILYGHQRFENAKTAILSDHYIGSADRELYLNRLQAARSGLDKVILENYETYVYALSNSATPFNVNKNEIGVNMMRGVEWLAQMELGHDYSGVQTGVYAREKYDSHIAQWRLTYKEYIGLSSGQLEVPEQIYNDHPGASSHHIKAIGADGFQVMSGAYPFLTVEWDGDTKAIKLDYAGAVAENEWTGNSIDLSRFQISEIKPFVSTMSGAYLNDPIVADGQYHLYRFEDITIPSNAKLYIFGNEYIHYSFAADEHLNGDKVDFYLSMKIVGDPTGQDPSNYATYYINAVYVVEDCSAWDFEKTPYADATCASNATEIGLCPCCGQEAIVEVPGTKLYHEVVGGYTWNETTKSYDTECAECGPISLPMTAELPKEVYDAVVGAGLSLERVYDYSTSDFVTESPNVLYDLDNESIYGAAMVLDGNRIANDKLWSYSVMNGKPMKIWNNSVAYAELTYNDLMAYNNKGYHLYSFKDVVPCTDPNSAAGATTYMWTWQWGFRNYKAGTEMSHLGGKKMDFYISVKNNGRIDFPNSSAEGGNGQIYVDRMIFVDTTVACEKHFPADGVEYTWNASNKQYEALCVTCGETIALDIRAELPQNVIDAVKAKGLDLSHVHEFATNGFTLSYGDSAEVISINTPDADSAVGVTTVIDPSKSTKPTKFNDMIDHFGLAVYKSASHIGGVSVADLRANEGKYVTYKIVEDNLLYNNNWLGLFRGTPVVDYSFPKTLLSMGLSTANLDLYLSAKVVGDPVFNAADADRSSWPVYYVDRIFVISDCEDFSAQGDYELLSEADCENNAVAKCTCPMCGYTYTKEVEGTALGHLATDYTYDSTTGKYTATCTRPGCGQVVTLDTIKAKLPEDLETEMSTKNIGFQHIKLDSTASDATPIGGQWKSVADTDSPLGKAMRVANTGAVKITDTTPMTLVPLSSTVMGSLTVDMLIADGKYHMYKIGDNVRILNSNYYKFGIGSHFLAFWDMKTFVGQTVDIYVSMKIQGNYYYVDRIIFMDECSDYITDDMYEANGEVNCMGGQVLTAECPVCFNIQIQEGGQIGHSFTDYRLRTNGGTEFVAYCDYGCGSTDIKSVSDYNHDMVLNGTELPEGVAREHIVQLYLPEDFTMFGSDYYYVLDDELNPELGGRRAVIRDRALATDQAAKNNLNMTQTGGIPVGLTGKYGSHSPGTFSSAEMRANADKGYCWYMLDDVVLMKHEDYNFLYLFGDSRLQIDSIADDLCNYKNKPVDLYMQMKIDGDPYCVNGSNPKYYWSMFMIVESCPVQDNWTITKEATCSETGEAVGNCDICGKQNSVVAIPKLPHTVVNGRVVSEATCYADRVESGRCQVCGTYSTGVSIPGTKLNHSFTSYERDSLGRLVAYCDYCRIRSTPSAAFGYCGGEDDGTNLSWVVNDDGILVITGTGAMADYEEGTAPWYSIRSYIKEVVIDDEVTTIGTYAFYNCTELKKVTIGESVTLIGEHAFEGCTGISSIKVPESVEVIKNNAFSDCDNLTDVTLPSGSTNIDKDAFSGCGNLTTIKIPEGTVIIEDKIFEDCSGLKEIVIPGSVTTIGTYAFYNCDLIEEVLIPASVTTIEECAFASCEKLTAMYFEGNAPTVIPAEDDGHSFDAETIVLYYTPGTTGWTDSEAYDADAGTWNGYKLAVWGEKCPSGDINGDGETNLKDLSRLFQYLADWDVEVNEAVLDVNGDGSVNLKDQTRLFQYLADWDVEIYPAS